MVSVIAFVSLVALVAAQRLAELAKSADHEVRLREAGAIEHAPGQMVWMRLVHIGWLAAAPLEVIALERPFVPWLAAAAGVVFVIGQALRIAAMRALGWRWCVRVLVLPDRAPVDHGIYRVLRHPNYLGVVLEIAALPLIHGAWITALVFSAANAALLWRRVRVENAALEGRPLDASPRGGNETVTASGG